MVGVLPRKLLLPRLVPSIAARVDLLRCGRAPVGKWRIGAVVGRPRSDASRCAALDAPARPGGDGPWWLGWRPATCGRCTTQHTGGLHYSGSGDTPLPAAHAGRSQRASAWRREGPRLRHRRREGAAVSTVDCSRSATGQGLTDDGPPQRMAPRGHGCRCGVRRGVHGGHALVHGGPLAAAATLSLSNGPLEDCRRRFRTSAIVRHARLSDSGAQRHRRSGARARAPRHVGEPARGAGRGGGVQDVGKGVPASADAETACWTPAWGSRPLLQRAGLRWPQQLQCAGAPIRHRWWTAGATLRRWSA